VEAQCRCSSMANSSYAHRRRRQKVLPRPIHHDQPSPHPDIARLDHTPRITKAAVIFVLCRNTVHQDCSEYDQLYTVSLCSSLYCLYRPYVSPTCVNLFICSYILFIFAIYNKQFNKVDYSSESNVSSMVVTTHGR